MKNSNGLYLYDDNSEEFFLDLRPLPLPIGYNHQKLTTSDMLDMFSYLAVDKKLTGGIPTEEEVGFLREFGDYAMPDYMGNIHFAADDQSALNTAVMVSFEWKKSKSDNKKHKAIVFDDFLAKFDNGNCLFDKISLKPEPDSLSKLKQIVADSPDEIACIIVEPVFVDSVFMEDLRKLADENGIMLIFNEINCGMGITRKLWAHQHYGIEPDIIVFGDMMQVCGFFAKKDIKIPCGLSHKANLLDLFKAVKMFEIIEEDCLIENAGLVGGYLSERLEQLSRYFPKQVHSFHSKGLLFDIELSSSKTRNQLISLLFDLRVLVYPKGDRNIVLRPPLNTGKNHIDKMFALMKEALDEI